MAGERGCSPATATKHAPNADGLRTCRRLPTTVSQMIDGDRSSPGAAISALAGVRTGMRRYRVFQCGKTFYHEEESLRHYMAAAV